MAVFTAPRPVIAKGKTYSKPRNPLVAPSLFRRAGSHGSPVQGQRQQTQQLLRFELKQLTKSIDDNGP